MGGSSSKVGVSHAQRSIIIHLADALFCHTVRPGFPVMAHCRIGIPRTSRESCAWIFLDLFLHQSVKAILLIYIRLHRGNVHTEKNKMPVATRAKIFVFLIIVYSVQIFFITFLFSLLEFSLNMRIFPCMLVSRRRVT